MVVISNELKHPVTDRALIGNRLYKPVTNRSNFCNGLYLTSITKNTCNGRLRSPLQKSTLVTGVVEANPGVVLVRLWVTAAKQQPLQMWVHVLGDKGPLQMLHDLFVVFT
jgi:hypothetical protein